MSSIFGFFSIDSIPNTKGLALWNSVYGNESQLSSQNDLLIGSYLSHFSSHPMPAAPILTDSNSLAVIDAIIYNRDEIIQETGAPSSISDEELLFTLCLQKGYSALKKVNGDFVGAIFDKKSQSLTVFRDHTGCRPLYYYFDGHSFVFSTDMRGILSQSSLNISINKEWAYKFFNGYIPCISPATEYNNLFHVPHSTCITVNKSNDKLVLSQNLYWKPASKKIRYLFPEKYKKQLRFLIENSIKLRLDSIPGKIGVEMSGGLDSSVIDVLVNRFGRDGIYFSWSKSPEKRPIIEANDERVIINKICDSEKIKCHYNDENQAEPLNRLKSAIESKKLGLYSDNGENFSTVFPPGINTFQLFITADFVKSQGSSVVFSGHGGDEGVSHRSEPYELFYHHEYYHYLRYHFARTHGQKRRLSSFLRRLKLDLFEARPELLSPFLDSNSFRNSNDSNATEGTDFKSFITGELWDESKNYYLSPLFFAYDPVKYVSQGFTRVRPETAACYSAYAEVQYIFPYLDYRVLDYALSIPRYNFLNKGRNRYIYKETFKDIIPEKLYKNTPKESLSNRPISENKYDWFPVFDQKRRALIDHLDEKVWEGILDFTELRKWAASDRPSDEQKDVNQFVLEKLTYFFLAQSCLLESSRVVEGAKYTEKQV